MCSQETHEERGGGRCAPRLRPAVRFLVLSPFLPPFLSLREAALTNPCSFHAYGLVAILHLSVYENTKVVLLPKFTRELFFSSISKFKITHLSLVPPMLLAMLAAPKDVDFSSVRFVLCGAAPLAGEVVVSSPPSFVDD